MVLRPDESVDDLVASMPGSCPVCGGRLRKWGHGRRRTIRGFGASGFRPGRVRCVACGVTQVVLPADVLVRRRDAVAVVGRAWRSFARGAGARRVAHQLGVPMETVRGWLRRLRLLARAQARRPAPSAPGGAGALHGGLVRLAAAAEVAGWHGEEDLWRFASYRSQGRLLATPTDPAPPF
jgi:hypothetical protein